MSIEGHLLPMPSIFTRSNLWKTLAAWLAMLAVSVANGAVRDFTYGRHISELFWMTVRALHKEVPSLREKEGLI